MNAAQEIKKFEPRAKHILSNTARLNEFINKIGQKLSSMVTSNSEVSDFVDKMKLLIRMVKAYAQSDYQVVPWNAIVSILGALIYFVTPLDLIPDFIPLLGLVDDATVILWVFRSFAKEISAFEVWENARSAQ